MNEEVRGTVKKTEGRGAGPGIPERQNPYQEAFVRGFDVLLARELSSETLKELGVSRVEYVVSVPVVNGVLLVDLKNRTITIEGGGEAKMSWSLLALHYLCADETGLDTLEVSLSHFPDCRGYCTVFSNRVIKRFLGTVGRTAESFETAAERIGGKRVDGSGLRYSFSVLPRVLIDIVRYEGDEEFGPDANIVYRADAANLLPAEDRIVAGELLLEALSGRPLEEAARQ
jgi:hypothetical protein